MIHGNAEFWEQILNLLNIDVVNMRLGKKTVPSALDWTMLLQLVK